MKFLSILIIGLIGMAMLTEGYSVCSIFNTKTCLFFKI